jgi:two-component system, NarL family, nitrate/nitrite response regulator NarL
MIDLIRVAVIDDHPLFREGVVNTLTTTSGIEVVGEGSTTSDALKLAQERAPDVMLVDIGIPGSGIEAAAKLASAHPNIRVIMLTASEDEQHVASALKAGARGYLLKGSCGHEVVEAVKAIAAGESYVAPNLAARLLSKKSSGIEAIAEDIWRNLTSREVELLGFLAEGKSNKEIARDFNTTERTVKHHMTNIMQKLDVRNRVQAVLKFQHRRAAD